MAKKNKPKPAAKASAPKAPTNSPLTSVVVPIDDLRPHPRNYQKHPPEQAAHIRRSIEEHGFYRNVVAARDGTILAGHGVWETAKAMGLKTIPVVKLDVDPNSPQALKVVTGDNEIGALADRDDRDDRALTELLKEIALSTTGLEGTGFDKEQLAALVMVTRHATEIASFDEAAQWVGMPEYQGPADALKVVVSFLTADARDAFMKVLNVKSLSHTDGKTWSFWWPPKPNGQPGSVEFKAKAAK